MVAYANNPSFWNVVWWMAMWTILVVFLPILGVVSYPIARPSETAVEVM